MKKYVLNWHISYINIHKQWIAWIENNLCYICLANKSHQIAKKLFSTIFVAPLKEFH